LPDWTSVPRAPLLASQPWPGKPRELLWITERGDVEI
jgi:hypothetical protein